MLVSIIMIITIIIIVLLIGRMFYKKYAKKAVTNKSCIKKGKNPKPKTVTFHPIIEYVYIPPIQ